MLGADQRPLQSESARGARLDVAGIAQLESEDPQQRRAALAALYTEAYECTLMTARTLAWQYRVARTTGEPADFAQEAWVRLDRSPLSLTSADATRATTVEVE